MTTRRRLRAAVLVGVAAVGLLLPACDTSSPPRFGAGIPIADVHGYEPVAEPELPGTLTGRMFVYLDPSGVTAVDATTGRRRWTTPIPGLLTTSEMRFPAPVVNTTGGRSTIYVAAFVARDGAGSQRALEVLALDATTGARRWRLPIPVPSDFVDRTVTLVGAVEDTLVVTVGTRPGITYGVDTRAHRLRWTNRTLLASVVDGPIVVGRRDVGQSALVGVRIRDGVPAWNAHQEISRIDVDPLGDGLFHELGDVYDGDYFNVLRRTDTGAAVKHVELDDQLRYCRFDRRATIVCASWADELSDSDLALAYDSRTLRPLWKVTGAQTPEITAAWDGVLYGERDGDPVMLDARTGAGLGSPGVVPLQVNEYAAVTIDAGRIMLHTVSR